MVEEPAIYRAVSDALSKNGLIARSGFHFGNADDAPSGPSGLGARSIILVGQAGTTAWPHFVAWRGRQPRGNANPLDAWSRGVIEKIAEEIGARAVAPSDRPYLPFQQWAMRAEALNRRRSAF